VGGTRYPVLENYRLLLTPLQLRIRLLSFDSFTLFRRAKSFISFRWFHHPEIFFPLTWSAVGKVKVQPEAALFASSSNKVF